MTGGTGPEADAQATAKADREEMSFTERRLLWLRQLAADRELRASTVRVALALVERFNSTSGYVSPSVDYIACAIGSDCRSVQNSAVMRSGEYRP